MTNSAELPLTPGQLGVWLDVTFRPESATAYSLGMCMEIVGELQPEHFRQAVLEVVNTTPALRAHLSRPRVDSPPLQRIEPPLADDYVSMIDLSSEQDPPVAARLWMNEDLRVPFDLLSFPLFRIVLLKLAQDWYHGYMVFHHLIVDGISLRILQARFAETLDAIAAQSPPPQRRADVAHEAYMSAVKSLEESPAQGAAKVYWQDLHRDPVSLVSLSTRASQRAPVGEVVKASFIMSQEEIAPLGAIAQQIEVSITELLIASVVLFVHRVTGATEIPVGLPTHGRPAGLRQSLVWMCSNVLPLRFRVERDLPFDSFVSRVSAHLREALKHQDYRYEAVRRGAGAMDATGLYGISVNVVRVGRLPSSQKLSDLHTNCWVLSAGPVEDLSILIADGHNGDMLYVELRGNAGLYAQWELDRHALNFSALLRAVAQVARAENDSAESPAMACTVVA